MTFFHKILTVLLQDDKIEVHWKGNKAEIDSKNFEIYAENELMKENLEKNIEFFCTL